MAMVISLSAMTASRLRPWARPECGNKTIIHICIHGQQQQLYQQQQQAVLHSARQSSSLSFAPFPSLLPAHCLNSNIPSPG
jgi:hypothetical protein